ncbi:MAG: hypothetical protein AB7V18_08265 [Pyrinomonadaceae bacterium]
MPEPISIALSLGLGYSALSLYGYGRSNTAISSAAQSTKNAVAELLESRERSQSLFGEKAKTISAIQELAKECAENDWDGNDSLALDSLTVWNAEEFIRSLPDDFPMPEVSAEPDGAISLDWIVSKNRMVSLSVGESNRLAFAWLDGTERGHAVVNFDGVNTPTRFFSEIHPLVKYAKPSLRAA